jgi:uncharacterized membrane protein YeiB
VFFESKFWSLFSLLFGISFWLQIRIDSATLAPAAALWSPAAVWLLPRAIL